MPSDLLRPTERAAVISLKANAALLDIVAKSSIDPVTEAPDWPFIRIDGTQSIPGGRGCTARAEVSFLLHSFAKPRYVDDDPAGAMEETAKDHAGRLNSAVVEAIHNHAFTVEGRRYRFVVRSSRLMRDGAEADAWHGIASVVARAFQG
ncbi:DUF3168 domain-containing protein [Novosphingobium sp. KA1]|uniref:tail completion protein gp17 n=1 Tax=Novosphingobium sp. (strain KA1) TaxID=164608 RepID=UPI001A90672A|nr:DUF3168 domain-containing protein [Novosphingobium sp. KA1]QSR18409.1 hypothetical protein CA833_14635 [Novosphingobium sp. KA1]